MPSVMPRRSWRPCTEVPASGLRHDLVERGRRVQDAAFEVLPDFEMHELHLVTLSAATECELLNDGDTIIETFGWPSSLLSITAAAVTAWAAV